MTFDEYWDANWADVKTEIADRTFGEEVWNAAQEAVLMPLLGAGDEENTTAQAGKEVII